MSTVIKYETEMAGSEPAEKHRAPQSWKQDVARRVAAHRSRNGHSNAAESAEALIEIPDTEERRRAAKIAAAVAARYAAAPSYRQMMDAPAPIETPTLFAVEPLPEAAPVMLAPAVAIEPADPLELAELAELAKFSASNKKPSASISVEEVMMATEPARPVAQAPRRMRIEMLPSPPETLATELLPVRVIESPRELIAVRRMRPRLAETTPTLNSQLRIFEVEPDQISTTPEPPAATAFAPIFSAPVELEDDFSAYTRAPEPAAIAREVLQWEQHEAVQYAAQSIPVIDDENAAVYTYATPVIPAAQFPSSQFNAAQAAASSIQPGMRECERAATIVIQTAPIELRLMAMLVDLCITTGIAFTGVLIYMMYAAHPMSYNAPSKLAIALGAVGYVALWLAYQVVCFATHDATIGMRYARIGLCTFEDENPSRLAMCGRALALLLSFAPMGLGCLWALMDMDGLGWHDRMTHIYQRGY